MRCDVLRRFSRPFSAQWNLDRDRGRHRGPSRWTNLRTFPHSRALTRNPKTRPRHLPTMRLRPARNARALPGMRHHSAKAHVHGTHRRRGGPITNRKSFRKSGFASCVGRRESARISRLKKSYGSFEDLGVTGGFPNISSPVASSFRS